MQTTNTKRYSPTLPNQHDMILAAESSRMLAAMTKDLNEPMFKVKDANGKTFLIKLPVTAVKLLVDILVQMAEGNAVTLMPIHAELTTQEAADLLNVSRPHLVKLLDNKEIPFHKVGTHRRVYAEDVLNYKANIDNERLKTLEELAKQAQDLDMGYEE